MRAATIISFVIASSLLLVTIARADDTVINKE